MKAEKSPGSALLLKIDGGSPSATTKRGGGGRAAQLQNKKPQGAAAALSPKVHKAFARSQEQHTEALVHMNAARELPWADHERTLKAGQHHMLNESAHKNGETFVGQLEEVADRIKTKIKQIKKLASPREKNKKDIIQGPGGEPSQDATAPLQVDADKDDPHPPAYFRHDDPPSHRAQRFTDCAPGLYK